VTVFQAILIGIIQGLTEFLPVSSSGHLVLATALYKLFTGSTLPHGNPEEIFLDIMVHLATVVAIFIYFWPELSAIFSPKNFIEHLKLYKISSFKTIKSDMATNYNEMSIDNKMLFFLGIGTLATVAIAYPGRNAAEYLTQNPFVVCFMLLITGTLLFVSHKLSEKKVNKTDVVSWKKAIIIGLAQGFAILPGISRSGSTIAAGLLTGLDRVSAARFSFILSSPIIILAASYEGIKFLREGHIHGFNWIAIASGSIAAGTVGYFCIKYFIKFLSKYNLLGFAYYCWFIGIFMAIFFFFNPSA
jgi:undecaprenyl-diphosphatase